MRFAKHILPLFLAYASAAGVAQAADLATASEDTAAAVLTASDRWDGFYLGIFAGGGSGQLTEDLAGAELKGHLLGATAGYNYALDGGLVVGVAGDVAWSSLETTPDFFTLDWTGSVRGRIGYDAGMFLPYLTAGVAFGSATETLASRTVTHIGWTVGAGVEVALGDNLSLDGAYRYTDLGDEAYGGNVVGYEFHQLTVGLNWKF